MNCRSEEGIIYGLWGKTDQARKAIDEFESLSKKQYVSPATFALIFATMGDRDARSNVLRGPTRRSPLIC
jgi:hypothetical protein